MRVTILGCGASGGTPLVDRGWGRCNPDNPRNRRLRPSVLVEEGATTVLIDTSPDLRQQLLNAEVKRLDAVLYTHGHADHTHGIDDLRPINRLMRAPIDMWADAATLASLRDRFGYVFEDFKPGVPIYRPWLRPHELDGAFDIGPLHVTPFDQDHGFMRSVGYRIGDFAYSTDLVELPDASFDTLAGVKTWVVGCLRWDEHPTHAHVDKVLAWTERVQPDQVVLTHMDVALDYDELAAYLPAQVRPGYDGMVLDL